MPNPPNVIEDAIPNHLAQNFGDAVHQAEDHPLVAGKLSSWRAAVAGEEEKYNAAQLTSAQTVILQALEQQQSFFSSHLEHQCASLRESLYERMELLEERLRKQPMFFSNRAPHTEEPISPDIHPATSSQADHPAPVTTNGETTPNGEAKSHKQLSPTNMSIHKSRSNDSMISSMPLDMNLLLSKVSESAWFDGIVGVLILSNTISMWLNQQFLGHVAAVSLGFAEGDGPWRGAEDVFFALENFFCIAFVIEMFAHIYRMRMKYFMEWANVVDACVVVGSCFNLYFVEFANVGSGSMISVFRIARIFRVVRLLRGLHVTKYFASMRVLIKTTVASIGALFWSMLLMMFIIFGAAIFISSALHDFIKSGGASERDTREWCYRYYGTAAKASWTLFEVTFSGGWPSVARKTIEDVNGWFSLYWIGYIVIVWFAMIRIITALFLKETMLVASNDADMMAMEKMKTKEKFANKLRKFFEDADTSGDGFISQAEFIEIMGLPETQQMFLNLELELHEVTGLFNMLDDGDGQISFEEFLGGAMRLKGNARAVDSVAIMHEQHKITRKLEAVEAYLQSMFGSS